MPRNSPGWRGVWYVYNHVTREFVRSMAGREGVQWTPGLKYAQRYKNPALAQKCASRLNALLHHPGSACWPCQPVSVVTGEAARCLDAINRRDGKGNDLIRPASDPLRGPPDARSLWPTATHEGERPHPSRLRRATFP